MLSSSACCVNARCRRPLPERRHSSSWRSASSRAKASWSPRAAACAQRGHHLAETGERGVVVARDQQPDGLHLERRAELVDLVHVVVGELGHERAAAGLVVHEALGAELRERLADRAAADAELARDLGLDEALAGSEAAAQEAFAEEVGRRLGERVGRAERGERFGHLLAVDSLRSSVYGQQLWTSTPVARPPSSRARARASAAPRPSASRGRARPWRSSPSPARRSTTPSRPVGPPAPPRSGTPPTSAIRPPSTRRSRPPSAISAPSVRS